MTAPCPSELALEAHLLDPERSPIAQHVAGCARCAGRLAQMRAEGEEFDRRVYPATVEALEERAAHRPWWRRPGLLVPVPALAAAAMMFLRSSAPPEGYVGPKGGELGLTVYAPGPTGVAPVLDGRSVAAGASIRFRIRVSSACHLRILSVDAAGAVSRLFPADAPSEGRLEPGEHVLPGGAQLDGRPGPERIYAVCTHGPPGWPELESSVRAAVSRPASERAPSPLAGLPKGAAWQSVLLEKRP